MPETNAEKTSVSLELDSEGEDEILNPPRAAKLIGVHPHTIRRWIYDGRLPAQKSPGQFGRFRIKKRDLLKALEYEPSNDSDE